MIPLVMENVKGIITIVRNAGIALSIESQSISAAWPIIMAPISTETEAVAAIGTWLNSGAKSVKRRNKTPTVMAVRPVWPPSLIPAADSTYTISGADPRAAPITDPTPHPKNANLEPGMSPPEVVSPAIEDIPKTTPLISIIPMNKKADIAGISLMISM